MSASPLELPIEPIPDTIVLREVPAEPSRPPIPRAGVAESATLALESQPFDVGRDEAGPAPLRLEESEPASPVTQLAVPMPVAAPPRPKPVQRQRQVPPPRFEDHLRPVRAAFGLVALVAFAGLAVAAAIGVAIGAVAFALRNAAGG